MLQFTYVYEKVSFVWNESKTTGPKISEKKIKYIITLCSFGRQQTVEYYNKK